MRSKSVFGFDLLLFIATIALVSIGIAFIFSSGVTSTGIVYSNEYIRQTVWALSGIGLLILFISFDYSFVRRLSLRIYLILIALLIFTLFIGRVVNGSRSWLGIWEFGIQPSEFCKIAVILFLAHILDKKNAQIKDVRYFVLYLGIVLFPMGLVLLQPDLGTASVFLPIALAMFFIAGARTRHILFIVFTGFLLVVLTMLPAYEIYLAKRTIPAVNLLTNTHLSVYLISGVAGICVLAISGYFFTKKSYFYWIAYFSVILMFALCGSFVFRKVLKEYQIMRLIVFLDPNVDARGAGWNIIQSVTAVGSGGLWGKGFLKGTQSHYRYIPQQSTDFIFSIISEEWGFAGVSIVFALFLIIIIRGIFIIRSTKDRFAGIAAAGIIMMIFFHFLVNVGMAISLMPVTGIPLFFLSYGGSSLWTVLISIGLLMSFYLRRFKV
ncbi:MAG: rod shape-determining protein RodA [Spirochaetales bacterium]|jgi:rod shape determining protein RodA|nr:rod shape-determining protein RodA [Spirochaetales bacterium]